MTTLPLRNGTSVRGKSGFSTLPDRFCIGGGERASWGDSDVLAGIVGAESVRVGLTPCRCVGYCEHDLIGPRPSCEMSGETTDPKLP